MKMKFSVRWFLIIIGLIFAVLSVASIFADNNLLWGLDSFPLDTPSPSGMNLVQTIAYISMLGSVGLLWFRTFIVRSVDSQSLRLALVFSAVAVVAHIALIGFIRVWELHAAGDASVNLLNSKAWDVDPQGSSVRALTCLIIGFPLQHAFARKDPALERNRWLTITGGLIALGSLTVVGHTAYQPPTWVSHGMDFVHGVGASLWFGGLLGLVLFMRAAFRDRSSALDAARVLSEFSTAALYSVVALAVSGSVIAYVVKDDVLDLTGSPFAKALSVKLMLIIIPVTLAAYNRFRLIPQIQQDPDSTAAWVTLRKTIMVELVALFAILVVTGVLVLASPVGS